MRVGTTVLTRLSASVSSPSKLSPIRERIGRNSVGSKPEIFSLMLEAEYEYYRNNDFNAAMTLFKRALEINNFQPIFISASEICSIENRFDVYEDLAKKYHYND